jgi:hypothetical protein
MISICPPLQMVITEKQAIELNKELLKIKLN